MRKWTVLIRFIGGYRVTPLRVIREPMDEEVAGNLTARGRMDWHGSVMLCASQYMRSPEGSWKCFFAASEFHHIGRGPP